VPRARTWASSRRRGHPLGGVVTYEDTAFSSPLEDPLVLAIAEAHGRTAAQVVLRWHLQSGRSAIPESTGPGRIAQNADVFGFHLTGDDIARIDALDRGVRGGPEQDDRILESHPEQIPEP
jgi:2,5-diketo-D-gluconate reductase A